MRFIFAAIAAMFIGSANAETIGEVSTVWKLIGPDHKIVVDVFDDPKINGIACYVSHAKTGGLMGAVGLAEDKSDASVACRQTGEISFKEGVGKNEEVFNEKHSILFKHMRVVRIPDTKRNVVTYLVYSDKLIEGSPKNSISAVNLPANVRIQVK